MNEEEFIARLEDLVRNREVELSSASKAIDEALQSILEEMLHGEC